MFLIARLLAVVAFTGIFGGLGFMIAGLIGSVVRFFPLMAVRVRLARALEVEHSELFRHMQVSSFSSWFGLHRELIGVPHELVASGTDELRLAARHYGQHYTKFLLYLKFMGFGTLALAVGIGAYIALHFLVF